MKLLYRILISMSAVILIHMTPGHSFGRKEINTRQKELQALKEYVQIMRDSLQSEMTYRWRQKQRFLEQREIDKKEIVELHEAQEYTQSSLLQLKEECFAQEKIIDDEQDMLAKIKDQWAYVISSCDDIIKKEMEYTVNAFPTDMEQMQKDFESVYRDFSLSKNPRKLLQEVTALYMRWYNQGQQIQYTRKDVLPDNGTVEPMTMVQFGNVFAYALNDSAVPYIIRQTGKLGIGRYVVEKVTAPALASFIRTAIPDWINNHEINNDVLTDILHSANSEYLISGEKVDRTTKLKLWFKSGGPIMIPLAILLLWAIVLVAFKMIQFFRKHKSNKNLSNTVVQYLNNNKRDEAYCYAQRHRGVVAHVVKTCLEHAQWNRTSAEKAVREILVEEVPQLNKFLATLSVIAGTAPLCGLLGTVSGMINLFDVITHYGTGDPKILAGGISEALITTQTGLIIAVPILLVHNFLRNQSLHIQNEMQKHAIRILNRLWPEVESP